MRDDLPRASGPWGRYIGSAAQLRVTLEHNVDDYVFGRQGGRIFYLFDANIVQIFLNPTKEVRHISTFGEGTTAGHLATTAMITAEFLFSRKLSGQHGSPPLLTQDHAEDVGNIIRRIGTRVGDLLGRDAGHGDNGETPASKAELHGLLAAARAGAIDRDELVRKLGELIPRVASKLFSDPAYEAHQFQRLLDEDLLRPLRLHPAATRDVVDPDPRMVNVWMRQLQHARPRHQAKAAGGDHGLEQRTRRDAVTLAQLLLLNEAARDAATPTRYVLVTTDKVLSRAYASWFWSSGRAAHDVYALRHPSQYVPILNAEQMNNGVERTDLVEHMRQTLDSLFEILHRYDDDYVRALLTVADPDLKLPSAPRYDPERRHWHLFTHFFRRGQKGSVEELRRRWLEAASSAVVLNASVLQQRFAKEFDLLEALFEGEAGVQQSVLDHLERLLRELEAAHADFVIGGYLSANEEDASAPGTSGSAEPERSPLLVRWPSQSALGGVSLAVVRLADMTQMLRARRLPATDAAVDLGPDFGAMFFSACIAFRLGEWALALRYSRRALSLLRGSADRAAERGDVGARLRHDRERHELYYLEAAATRFAADDTDAYATARNHLSESLTHYRRLRDPFGLVRTYCGQANLQLALVYGHEFQPERRTSYSPDILKAFLQAVDAIRTARRVALPGQPASRDPAHHLLERQVHLTTVNAAIYANSVAAINVFDDDEVEASVAYLEREMAQHPDEFPLINKVELGFLRWQLADEGEQDARKAALLAECDRSEGRLPEALDRALVSAIRRWLDRTPVLAYAM